MNFKDRTELVEINISEADSPSPEASLEVSPEPIRPEAIHDQPPQVLEKENQPPESSTVLQQPDPLASSQGNVL